MTRKNRTALFFAGYYALRHRPAHAPAHPLRAALGIPKATVGRAVKAAST